MRVAVPVHCGLVSPVFDWAQSLLLVDHDGDRVRRAAFGGARAFRLRPLDVAPRVDVRPGRSAVLARHVRTGSGRNSAAGEQHAQDETDTARDEQ